MQSLFKHQAISNYSTTISQKVLFLLASGFSILPLLELDAGDGSLLCVGLKSTSFKYIFIVLFRYLRWQCNYVTTYICTLLESIPDGSGRDAGVVDVGQAGGSPKAHLEKIEGKE